MEQVGNQTYTQADIERYVIKIDRDRKRLEAQIAVSNQIRSLAKRIVEKVPSYLTKTNLDVNPVGSFAQRQRRDPDITTESIPAWLLQTRHKDRWNPDYSSSQLTTEIYLDTNGNLWVVENRFDLRGSNTLYIDRKYENPRPITNEEIIPFSQVTPTELSQVYETWVKSFADLANISSF